MPAWAANSATSRDLPTPGIAADDDDPAALPLGAGRGHGGEVAQLLVPADERAGARRRCRPLAADAIRGERPLLALDLGRLVRVRLEMVGHLLPGVGADEHLAGSGQAAQAGGGVHRVAGQRIVAGARVAAAGDDEAGVDAGVHAQARPARRRLQVGDQPFDRGVQLERGRDGAARVVAARQRNAEEGHDLVADELVHGAAVALDHGGRLGLDPAHDRLDLLRVRRLVQGGVAGQVGEHHGRVAALAGVARAARRAAARSRPQPLQNRCAALAARRRSAGQAACRAAPQALQNRAPAGLSASQRAQGMGTGSSVEASIIAGSRRRRQAVRRLVAAVAGRPEASKPSRAACGYPPAGIQSSAFLLLAHGARGAKPHPPSRGAARPETR